MKKLLLMSFLGLCSSLFGQNAQISLTVDPTDVIKEISPYIYGKNHGIPSRGDTEVDWRQVRAAGITMYRQHGGNNCTKYNWQRKLTGHPDWYQNVYGADWDREAKRLLDHAPSYVQGMWAFQLLGWVAKSNAFNFADWDYNRANWWNGVGWNLAGGGMIEPFPAVSGVTPKLVNEGDPNLYLEPWSADETTGILNHWFQTLGLDKERFKYWNMDNEPCVWNGTHNDVCKGIPAEEFIQKYIAVATRARTIFPDIKITGPSFTNEWQWYNWQNQGTIPEDPNNSSSKRISWSEYFIKRIAEEQQRTGLRLLDVLCYHSYLCDANRRDISLNLYRIFYDTEYVHPAANGVKTVNGGWDNSINKQYIFKRAEDWLEKYMGADHGVSLGITEMGCLYDNDANVIAVSYASLLGTFAENNVELLTPWDWYIGQYETVHLFRRYTGTIAVRSKSSENLTVSAYSSINHAADTLSIVLVNRDNNSRNISVKIEEFEYEDTKITCHQLYDLPLRTETFFSRTENALRHSELRLVDASVEMNLPKLSVTVLRIPLKAASNGNGTTDVGEINEDFKLKVYPNPAKGQITIETEGISGAVNINLTDMSGRIVKTVQIADGSVSTILDISSLPKGAYIINMFNNNRQYSKKIIVE